MIDHPTVKAEQNPDCIHYTIERVEDGTYECTACGQRLLVVVE